MIYKIFIKCYVIWATSEEFYKHSKINNASASFVYIAVLFCLVSLRREKKCDVIDSDRGL
jgi:hypothetical protein